MLFFFAEMNGRDRDVSNDVLHDRHHSARFSAVRDTKSRKFPGAVQLRYILGSRGTCKGRRMRLGAPEQNGCQLCLNHMV